MVKAMLSCQWNLGNFSRPCQPVASVFLDGEEPQKGPKFHGWDMLFYFSQMTRCIYVIYVIYEYGWFGTGLWLKTRSRHTIWTPTHFWPLKSKVLSVCHRLLSKCVHGCFQHPCYDFCPDLHVCWLHTHVCWWHTPMRMSARYLSFWFYSPHNSPSKALVQGIWGQFRSFLSVWRGTPSIFGVLIDPSFHSHSDADLQAAPWTGYLGALRWSDRWRWDKAGFQSTGMG